MPSINEQVVAYLQPILINTIVFLCPPKGVDVNADDNVWNFHYEDVDRWWDDPTFADARQRVTEMLLNTPSLSPQAIIAFAETQSLVELMVGEEGEELVSKYAYDHREEYYPAIGVLVELMAQRCR